MCKRLAVVAFGALRWNRFRFHDRELLSDIAAIGRAVADCIVDTIENAGRDVLAVETDGAYLALPSGASGASLE